MRHSGDSTPSNIKFGVPTWQQRSLKCVFDRLNYGVCVLDLTQKGNGSCFVICEGECGWCKQWKDGKAHEKSEPLLSNHLKRMRLSLLI